MLYRFVLLLRCPVVSELISFIYLKTVVQKLSERDEYQDACDQKANNLAHEGSDLNLQLC